MQSLCSANPLLDISTQRCGGSEWPEKIAMAGNRNTTCPRGGGNYIVVHMHCGALCSCANDSEGLPSVTVMGRHDVPAKWPYM